jgi:hypothetical protein
MLFVCTSGGLCWANQRATKHRKPDEKRRLRPAFCVTETASRKCEVRETTNRGKEARMAKTRNAFGCQDDCDSRADDRHDGAAATLRGHASEWSFALPTGKAASLTPLQRLLDSASHRALRLRPSRPGWTGNATGRSAPEEGRLPVSRTDGRVRRLNGFSRQGEDRR